MSRLQKMLQDIPEEWKNILYSNEEHKIGRTTRSSKVLLDRIVSDLESVPDSKLCPEPDKWFEFARVTPFDKIRVVAMGQDPYHTKKNTCYAHGLAFSCLGNVTPSLRNIYKCLERSKLLKDQKNIKTGDLTCWAEQGLLMLNTSLSTETSEPNKHQHIWASYTEFIIQRLCEAAYEEGHQLMFLLWGKNAQQISKLINSDFHIIKEWAHPSPMAQGSLSDANKFINCTHFIDANAFLEDWECTPIDWNVSRPLDADSDSDSDIELNIQEEKHAPKESKEGKDSDWFNGHSRKIIAFTDGSCYPNKKTPKARGGYASSIVQGPFKDTVIYGNLSIDKNYASNIRAEGQALISTLEFLDMHLDEWSECILVTDCELWINMVTKYMPRWSEEKFKEKANSDMTLKLWAIWKKLMAKDKELSLYHVRSHNKNGWKEAKEGTFEKYCYEQNDYVDQLCGYARKALKPGEIVISEAEYE
jgi:uracil-DNA glycosylase